MQMVRVPTLLARVGPLDIFDQTRLPPDQLIREGLTAVLALAPVYDSVTDRAADGADESAAAQLLWGAPIVRRADEIGVGELPLRRLGPLGHRDALMLALRMEARAGGYSWSEREAIYRYACEHRVALDGELSQLVAAEPTFAESIERYLSLAPIWRRAVEAGAVDVRTAELCGALPPAVLDAVSGAGRRLSFSNRRLVLTWLGELCGRNGLHEPAAVELARDVMQSVDPLDALRRLRYPRLSEMEDRFAALQKRLTQGTPLSIKAPPGFEGAAYELQLTLRSRDDLPRAIEALQRMQEEGDELFELL